MTTIEERVEQAHGLWAQGFEAELLGNFQLAYERYTEAHDRVTDCARLHRKAHVRLRRVNWRLGHYGELITDWALALFAPLGVFELVSRFAKSDGADAAACKQRS